MKTMLNLMIVSMLIITVGNLNAAASMREGKSAHSDKAVTTLTMAVMALDNVMEDPLNGIPQRLINKSEGIVILPGACKVAVGAFNGQGGRGIAMIHNEDGSWSNPFFVTLREGSLGYKIGPQASDIILLFKDRKDIIGIHKEEIILGSDVGVAAGPDNNSFSSSTDITFETEIYAYHGSKGLFTGVNLKGGILSNYDKLNDSLYGTEDVNRDEIFYGCDAPYNDEVNDLIEALSMYGE